jgi:hypothetical protein
MKTSTAPRRNVRLIAEMMSIMHNAGTDQIRRAVMRAYKCVPRCATLCIRLAAARMFYEPLPMILEQLTGESDDVRMRWRHGPRVGSEGRHRSIGDVIAWSFELCGAKERLLFDRLSVFAPGYDANPEDAVQGLFDDREVVDVFGVVDGNVRLVGPMRLAPTEPGSSCL